MFRHRTHLGFQGENAGILDDFLEQDIPLGGLGDEGEHLGGRRPEGLGIVDARFEGAASGGRGCQDGDSVIVEGHRQLQ